MSAATGQDARCPECRRKATWFDTLYEGEEGPVPGWRCETSCMWNVTADWAARYPDDAPASWTKQKKAESEDADAKVVRVPTDGFSTVRRARTLRERQPEVNPNYALIALHMATFATGTSGTTIYPSFARVARETGFHVSTVRRAVKRLEAIGELRRDKEGHRGSAACFTYLGVGEE